MVAEFRLERPNMSYVNINSNNTGVSEGGSSSNDHPGTVVRGNIIRGGDNTLMSGLQNADSGMRSLIMGGSGISDERRERSYERQQLYEGDTMQVTALPEPPVNTDHDAGRSVSSSAASTNSMPRLRVANLPRVTENEHSHLSNNGTLPRSYSANGGPFSTNSMNNSSFADGSIPYVPSVTTIYRATSIEYSSTTNSDFTGFGQNPGVAAGYGDQSFNRGPNSRRLQRHLRHKVVTNAAGASFHSNGGMNQGFINAASMPNGSMEEILQNQESLRRENEDLKRKLQLLVNTINDEEKLTKVLKCMEERKRSQLGII